MWWALTWILLALAAGAVLGGESSAPLQACQPSPFPRQEPALRRLGERCSWLGARTRSLSAAQGAASAFVQLDDYPQARRALAGFELEDDAKAQLLLAYVDSREGSEKLALQRYRRAAGLAHGWRDQQYWMAAANGQAHLLFSENQFEEAVRVLQPVLEVTLDSDSDRRQALQARSLMVRALFRLGDLSAAEAEFAQLQRASEGVEPSLLQQLVEGQLLLERGQTRSAEQVLERVRRNAMASGDRAFALGAVENLIGVALREGRWVEARALAEEVEHSAASLDPMDVFGLSLYDGIAAREVGRPAESLVRLSRAEALDFPAWRWRVESELGKTLDRLGRSEEASAAYQRSIAEVESLRSHLD